MGKALRTIGTAIVVAGLAVATGGAAIALGAGVGLTGAAGLASSTVLSIGGFSISAGAIIGAGTLLQSASTLMQPKVQRAGAAIEWTADADAPLHFPFGRVGVAGQIVHNAVFGPDNMYVGFVNVFGAAGPIDGFEGFTADDKSVAFDGAGKAITTEYANVMWRRTQVGFQPTASAMSITGLKNGATMPNWSGASRLNGKAAELRIMSENSKGSAYGGKVPTGITTLRGLRCWDPRLDSTYPGGSGSCRISDPDTWVYSTNAWLHALKWCLGLWEGPTGKGAPQVDYQVGGIGAKVDGIDVAAYVEGANLFDARSGWACAAWPSTDDDKAAVLDSFLQAGGGLAAQKRGRLSAVHRIAPRASVATITGADTAGPIELTLATPRKARINTLRPQYWSEDHKWQMAAASEVTSETWRAEDGHRKRSRPIEFNYVPNAQQAVELAALQIAHTREGIKGVIPLRSYMDGLEVGDCITLDEPDFVLDGLKCLILDIDDQAETDVLRVSFISETDAKYPFAYGETATPPPAPTLTPRDLTYVAPPGAGDWDVVPRPPAPGGGQLPGFDLAGVINNAMATRVLVEVGPAAEGPWVGLYDGPPTSDRIQITVDSGATYYVAVSYFNAIGNPSARTVYGPYVAPRLISDDTNGVGGTTAAELVAFFREIPRLITDSDQASEVLIRETLDRHERIVAEEEARIADILAEETARVAAITAEQAARVAALLAEAAARGMAIAGVTASVTTVATDLAAEITTRTSQYAATTTAVALVDSRVTTVAGDLTSLTTSVTTQFSTVNGNIAAVSASVTTVATDLATLTTSVTTQFSTVNGTLASHTTSISTNATAISAETTARTSAISTVNASIAAVVSSVSTVATDLATLTSSVTTQFSTVNGTLASHTTSISTNATAISAETTARTSAISAVAGSIAAVNSELVTVANNLASLTTSVTTQFSTVNGTLASHTTSISTNATAISAETSARTSAISAVNASIASVSSAVTTVASDLAAETTARLALAASTTSGFASVGTSLTALSSADAVLASSISSVSTVANGASSSATLALSALNGDEAYIALVVNVANQLTGQRINGVTRAIEFLGDYFSVTPGSGGGIEFDGPNKLFKIYDATSKTVLKASGDIRLWSGPSSVADGAETAENGVLAIGPGLTAGGRFNGQTLTVPFDTGAPSATLISLSFSYANIEEFSAAMVAGGALQLTLFDLDMSGDATADGEGYRTYEIEWRLVSANTSYGDGETITSGEFSQTLAPGSSIAFFTTGQVAFDFYAATKGGDRLMILQMRFKSGSATTVASVRNVRLRGWTVA